MFVKGKKVQKQKEVCFSHFFNCGDTDCKQKPLSTRKNFEKILQLKFSKKLTLLWQIHFWKICYFWHFLYSTLYHFHFGHFLTWLYWQDLIRCKILSSKMFLPIVNKIFFRNNIIWYSFYDKFSINWRRKIPKSEPSGHSVKRRKLSIGKSA